MKADWALLTPARDAGGRHESTGPRPRFADLAATLTGATVDDLIAVPHAAPWTGSPHLSVTTPDLIGATLPDTLIAFAMVARSRLFAFPRGRDATKTRS